jgi:ABC-2 type transport system ATP-binding protein
MKQKLAVARALLHRPALVFLDEPTSGLDPEATVSLRDDISALAAREGTTVFLTTHNLGEAEKVCGLVGVIRAGTLVALGTPEELRARVREPQVEIVGRGLTEEVLALLRARAEVAGARADGAGGRRVVVDLRAGAEVAPLVTLVVRAGAEVEEVRRSSATLEDAYLSLMESTS